MVNTAWPAPAKITCFCTSLAAADGYHLLQTVFQFLDLADELEFRLRDDGVVVRATEITGIAAESDLVVRAARLFADTHECSRGVEISITKGIPVGGGLGGGSSDAATVLVALNELWQLGLDTATLSELGLTWVPMCRFRRRPSGMGRRCGRCSRAVQRRGDRGARVTAELPGGYGARVRPS